MLRLVRGYTQRRRALADKNSLDAEPPLDEYGAMHNNTSMIALVLNPALVLNTVRSTGATG